MHFPRGSNNRFNEQSATRRTNNRVFDSQNNNRGGYNKGVIGANAPNDRNKLQEAEQHHLSFMMSSADAPTILPVRWTSQHGSGGNEDTNPNKMNSNFVIQYMCKPKVPIPPNANANINTLERKTRLRDGVTTQRQDYQDKNLNQNGRRETSNSYLNRRQNSVKPDRVLQEPMEWYDKCKARDRNKGIFTADQNPRNDATGTRQNPNGNRNGYECPEERDYFPYQFPSIWRDAFVYAQNASVCKYYQKESFNVKTRWECVEKFTNGPTKHYSKYNNQAECVTNGGQWLEFTQNLEVMPNINNEAQCNALKADFPKSNFKWARPINLDGDISEKCLVTLAAPGCKEMPFGRDNHLGNGADMEEIGYDMPLPYFPSGRDHQCVLRTRYNITTDDYDGWNTFADQNKDNSPVVQNPEAYIGATTQMQLAINTAQFGRTFQDRSHIWEVLSRPPTIPTQTVVKILSVQGKRCNIVQCYPAVEYDFVPRELKVSRNDMIQATWTGSNTHKNGPNGGDGQTGDDGQGKTGSDRSNIVGLMNRLDNYPLTSTHPANLFNNMKVIWSAYNPLNAPPTPKDLAIQMASSGYYKSAAAVDGSMNKLLDNTSASFRGSIFQMTNRGAFNYTCTRNNNFSNRSQKGTITVV